LDLNDGTSNLKEHHFKSLKVEAKEHPAKT